MRKRRGRGKKTLALLCSVLLAAGWLITGPEKPVYAEVGSVADDGDVTYDKNGDVLSSIGIDTSKMPEDYDPDSTDNPYGSDVKSMNRVSELLVINTNDNGDNAHLYGHNARLDGNIGSLLPTVSPLHTYTRKDTKAAFLKAGCFAAASDCDLKGTGRKQSVAVVYTEISGILGQRKITLCLRTYDPYNGTYSDAFELADLSAYYFSSLNSPDKLPFVMQSQLQVSCGDYDNDTVDEIAVYVPSSDGSERAKVSVYDLINGKDSDPYSRDSWMVRWNYALKETPGGIIPGLDNRYKNYYNNVDLTSGDADNDGTDDLIISYGASSTGCETSVNSNANYKIIARSINSESVLLYGSDKGQMLKESQVISYGDDPLIRVSFAFGDLDDDGTDELILSGQKKSEQLLNVSRVLGKYIYDGDSHSLKPELIQNMNVVEGSRDDDDNFVSSNGWDENYYSSPVMNTNLAVGKFFGPQSQTRIYLDSVLYSYNGSFSIEDELEDTSMEVDSSGHTVPKGSLVFTDIHGSDGKHQCRDHAHRSLRRLGLLHAPRRGQDLYHLSLRQRIHLGLLRPAGLRALPLYRHPHRDDVCRRPEPEPAQELPRLALPPLQDLGQQSRKGLMENGTPAAPSRAAGVPLFPPCALPVTP